MTSLFVGKDTRGYKEELLALMGGSISSIGMPGYLWPCFIPLGLWLFIHCLQGKGSRQAGRLGIIFGLSYFGILLWWLAPTISSYGDLPLLAAIPVIGLLVAFLALYPGLWAFMYRSFDTMPPILSAFLGAALWGVMEWLRGTLFTEFPWGPLALGLSGFPLMIQLADVSSIYGVSALYALVILLSYQVILCSAKKDVKGAFKVAVTMASIIGIVILYGFYRIKAVKEGGVEGDSAPLCLIAVQGAIPQSYKWDPSIRDRTLKTYFELTDAGIEACEDKAHDVLAVWPETAVTTYIEHDYETLFKIRRFVKDKGISLLFGAPSYELGPENEKPIFYNSAYLAEKDGVISGRYDKRHLVPFGEYMPLGPFSDLARKYLPTAGDFEAGHSGGVILSRSGLKIGVLICFESIFPELARESVTEGAQLLAVITNDAWFGRTQAPFLHEAMSVFRAVETRRWVVRAANTGISSIIDPVGKRHYSTRLFLPTVIEALGHPRDDFSLFVRLGQSGFFALILLLLLPILISVLYKRLLPRLQRSSERYGSQDL